MCRPTSLQLLWLSLLLPSLRCDNLRCYYSPVLEREREGTFELVVTECPPGELCFKADGRYGNHSALTARGCMAPGDCGQAHKLRLRGTVYAVSYACCDAPYCNAGLVVTATLLSVAAPLLAVAAAVAAAAGSL